MADGQVPRRVVVTGPRTKAGAAGRVMARREIAEQTELGSAYVRSLMRAELRLGLAISVLVAGVLAAIPLLLWLLPGLRTVRVLGIELPWLVLGVLVHPFVVLAAWFYVRRVERGEDEFADLLDRS